VSRKPPRYDIPKAAPQPLRLVQQFVNTIDLEHEREWLTAWLGERGVVASSESELDRAREVREAIRELLYANAGHALDADPVVTLNEAAIRARLVPDFGRRELVAGAGGLDGALGGVLAVVFAAMADGSWARLKACRNHRCRWAFWDESRNRSAQWCSMQLCGNRTKIRSYRKRRRAVA
jgi:predicted RNA-binding Zn ribbon-like protein